MTKTKRQPEYFKTFASEDAAWSWMKSKTRANRMPHWSWVMVEGPADDWIVMDSRNAIDAGFNYQWTA